ncbi:Septum-associated rare lipoprotein A [hydrothermal vent metagenome]|uniref:Septum-associated rare lipoprotein A n=1 Tax=hydrothermal vent metagenome TaxID=652676 RepID=A0A3B0UV94_9ZZZZ
MKSLLKPTFLMGSIFLLIHTNVLAQQLKAEGVASFYADKFVGRTTASGEKYKHSKLTAAHKTLPFGTKVKVTNLSNKKSVVVVINDRGPFVKGRIIDLSKTAAKKLAFINQGITKVRIKVVK